MQAGDSIPEFFLVFSLFCSDTANSSKIDLHKQRQGIGMDGWGGAWSTALCHKPLTPLITDRSLMDWPLTYRERDAAAAVQKTSTGGVYLLVDRIAWV
jgi:hypothetical protein